MLRINKFRGEGVSGLIRGQETIPVARVADGDTSGLCSTRHKTIGKRAVVLGIFLF